MTSRLPRYEAKYVCNAGASNAGRSHCVQISRERSQLKTCQSGANIWVTKKGNKPVGFYGPIVPPVPNAPSSRICGQNPRNDADATFLDPHISVVDCCCSAGTPPVLTQHATIGGRLPEWQTSKCISFISFVRIESNFFTIHRRHRCKK